MAKIRVVLLRTKEYNEQTLGILHVISGDSQVLFTCKTLELAYKDNQKNISSIPPGSYNLKRRISQKHKSHFHVFDVPNRSLILIHVGNFHFQIEGCILLGDMHKNLNNDNLPDVRNSRKTTNRFTELLWNFEQHTFPFKVIDAT